MRVAALTRHQLRILFKRFPGGAVLTGKFLDDYISAGRLEFGQVHGAMRAPEKRFCSNLYICDVELGDCNGHLLNSMQVKSDAKGI